MNKTNIKTLLTFILVLSIGSPIVAQDNIFLDRDFWGSNPTIETIDLKIKEGNNIAEANSGNFDGVTLAILQNAPNKTIFYSISKEGNDVNKLTHDGRSYLFWAANKGNVEMMQYLIDKGAKVNMTDDKGSTPLNFAAGSGQKNTEVYDLLIKHGANLQKDLTPSGANALLLAAPYDSDFSLINHFTSKGLDLNSVDTAGHGIFNYVAKTGNIDLMKQLQIKGVKGTDKAFIFASQGARGVTNGIDVYTYLESLGLNPKVVSNEGETSLHIIARRNNDMKVINYFLQKGLDVNQPDTHGNTPFLNASQSNNLEVVTLLSKQLQNINHVNKKGVSALALALANNTAEVVAFLLNNKSDVNLSDTEGNNLAAYIMQSYSSKKEDAVKEKLRLLENKGFKFGKPQTNGNTLYHLATDKNDVIAVKFVHHYHADVNAKNSEGLTALHKAAMKAQNIDILKYLISIGANKEATTEFDETAYDLASENELLLQQKVSIEFLK